MKPWIFILIGCWFGLLSCTRQLGPATVGANVPAFPTITPDAFERARLNVHAMYESGATYHEEDVNQLGYVFLEGQAPFSYRNIFGIPRTDLISLYFGFAAGQYQLNHPCYAAMGGKLPYHAITGGFSVTPYFDSFGDGWQVLPSVGLGLGSEIGRYPETATEFNCTYETGQIFSTLSEDLPDRINSISLPITIGLSKQLNDTRNIVLRYNWTAGGGHETLGVRQSIAFETTTNRLALRFNLGWLRYNAFEVPFRPLVGGVGATFVLTPPR